MRASIPRSWAWLGTALLGTALLGGCGDRSSPGPPFETRVLGIWGLRSVDGESVPDALDLTVTFRADGSYHVESSAHRGAGRFYRTERSARFEPVEYVEKPDALPEAIVWRDKALAALYQAARAGLRDDDARLVFSDRTGASRLAFARLDDAGRRDD